MKEYTNSDLETQIFKIPISNTSLRDYFASQAMLGELSSQKTDWEYVTYTDLTDLAEKSYSIADAMLKEREKNQ